MKKFYIITNEQRDPNLSVTHSIQDYIEAKGGHSSFYLSSKIDWSDRVLASLTRRDVDADCVIVLGETARWCGLPEIWQRLAFR